MRRTLNDDILQRRKNSSHRIILRDGTSFYNMLEVQLGLKPNDASVYIKLPEQATYSTHNAWAKADTRLNGKKQMTVDMSKLRSNDPGIATIINPYLSWHSNSGELHVNGYDDKEELFHLIKKSQTIRADDVKEAIYLVAQMMLPLNSESHPLIQQPPTDETPVCYFEVSDSPFRQNNLQPNFCLDLVLDKKSIASTSVVVQVYAHKFPMLEMKHLGHLNGTGVKFVAAPFSFLSSKEQPPINFSLFVYQPKESGLNDSSINPISFWGHTKSCKDDIVFQATKIAR